MEFLIVIGVLIIIIVVFILLVWLVKFIFANLWISKLISIIFAVASLVIAINISKNGVNNALTRSMVFLPTISFIFLMSQIILGDLDDYDVGISLYQILSLVGWGIGAAAVLYVVFLIFHFATFLVLLVPILLIIANVIYIVLVIKNSY